MRVSNTSRFPVKKLKLQFPTPIIFDWTAELVEPWDSNKRPAVYECKPKGGSPRMISGAGQKLYRKCKLPILFSYEQRSASGKYIPLDAKMQLPNTCTISNPVKCRTCGRLIYFDSRIRSRNELPIPLDYHSDSEPHLCPNKPRPAKFFKKAGFA